MEERIKELEEKIGHYKRLLRDFCGAPEILIENPEMLNPVPPNAEDIAWAKEFIEKSKKYE